MNKAEIHKRRKENWETPPEIFRPLHIHYSFDIDLAANERSRKCDDFIGPGSPICQDFLQVIVDQLRDKRCFINPPYGKSLKPFTEHIAHLATSGIQIVALLPASVDTNWFWDNIQPHAVIYFRRGRIQFLPRGSSNPGPSMLAEFNFGEINGFPLGWRIA